MDRETTAEIRTLRASASAPKHLLVIVGVILGTAISQNTIGKETSCYSGLVARSLAAPSK